MSQVLVDGRRKAGSPDSRSNLSRHFSSASKIACPFLMLCSSLHLIELAGLSGLLHSPTVPIERVCLPREWQHRSSWMTGSIGNFVGGDDGHLRYHDLQSPLQVHRNGQKAQASLLLTGTHWNKRRPFICVTSSKLPCRT